MAEKIDLKKLEYLSSIESAAYLNAILQVLIDMHAKDMSAEERAEYNKKINDRVQSLREAFRSDARLTEEKS